MNQAWFHQCKAIWSLKATYWVDSVSEFPSGLEGWEHNYFTHVFLQKIQEMEGGFGCSWFSSWSLGAIKALSASWTGVMQHLWHRDSACVCSPSSCTQEQWATVLCCVGPSGEGKVTGTGQLHSMKSGTESSFIPVLLWAKRCMLPVSQTSEHCVWNTALSTNNTQEFPLNAQDIKHCLT